MIGGAHCWAQCPVKQTSVNAELDELERQHARDRQLVAGLGIEVDSLYATTDTSAQQAALVRLEDTVATTPPSCGSTSVARKA